MPIICDSDSRPSVLAPRTKHYVVVPTFARVRAKGSDGEGGSTPAAAALPAVTPVDPGESTSTEESFPSEATVRRQLFEDLPFETPPRERKMDAGEFTAGVSHHWAPLLARAYLHPGRRLEVHMRDGRQCAHVDSRGRRCGKRESLQIRHKHEISRGGSHDLTNLITLCWRHHQEQHAHAISRFSPSMQPRDRDQGIASFFTSS